MNTQWFTVKKIRPQLWAIAEFNHFEKTVMFLMVGKTQAILFDTGMGVRSIHKVIRTITKLPIAVFLTHSHWDHVGGIVKTDTVYKSADFFDGQIFPLNDFSITIIKTPGHSPDSVSYLIKNKNWLFVGDTFYPGPLYAHFSDSNIEDYAQSLNKLVAITNNTTVILPGHNALTCDVALLTKASGLMKMAVRAKKFGAKELKGDGFSILLASDIIKLA